MANSRSNQNGGLYSSQFFEPYGVALDGQGNVYVSDLENGNIRILTSATPSDPSSWISTAIAGPSSGSFTFSYQDGPGSSAQFSGPTYMTVDSQGLVYVADHGNNCVRILTPSALVTAGTVQAVTWTVATLQYGSGTSGEINWPQGVVVDGASNLLVLSNSNPNNNTAFPIVYALEPNATPLTASTTWTELTTLPAATVAVGAQDGAGASATFHGPVGAAVDGAGNVFVADTGNHIIRMMIPVAPGSEATTYTVSTIAGIAGTGGFNDGNGDVALFNAPKDIALDALGNLYVADSANNLIRMLTPDSTPVSATTQWTASTIAGDATFRASGSQNGAGLGAAKFNTPSGLVMDGSGRIFVADTGNAIVRQLTPGGNPVTWTVSTYAGTPHTSGYLDGPASQATFSSNLQGIAVDGAGNVYVADAWNDAIRVISSQTGNNVTSLLGPGGRAFSQPVGVAVDGTGNVYVADTSNGLIRMATPPVPGSGASWDTVSTVLGSANQYVQPGPLPGILYNPTRLALAPGTGDLFLTVPDAVMKIR